MGKDFDFVESLLRNYKAIKARIFNLNRKLTMMQVQKKNAIEGQYLKPQILTDIPGAPRGSMKEGKLLLINDEEYERLCAEESFIKNELEMLFAVKECLDESLNSLSPVEKAIIYNFYVERKGWIEITNLVHYRERNCKYIKKQGLSYMVRSLEPYQKEARYICTIFALLDKKEVV